MGVIRELRAHGIKPDLIVGTSVGAIVGAVAASGLTDPELASAVDSTDRDVFMEWAKPQLGLLGGHAIHEFIDKNVKQHAIESFPLRFAAVALEADRACIQVFNAGDPGKAVQASATIPVLLSPPKIAGRYYLDGGLASPLPVRIARALGAQHVIAVDVTFDPADRPFASITEAFWRTSLVMKWALAVSERSDADFVIRPAFPAEDQITFPTRRMLVETGAQAVRNDLEAIRKALRENPPAPPGVAHPSLTTMLCPELKLGVPQKAMGHTTKR